MLGLVPMRDTVTLIKAEQLDNWGLPLKDTAVTPSTHKANVSYNSKNEEITVASGEVIRFTAQILIEGKPAITYEDFLEWVDPLGNTFTKRPVEILYKRDFSGSVLAVKVVV